MGQAQMQALAARLTDDPALRAEFQRDPETAAATAGIDLLSRHSDQARWRRPSSLGTNSLVGLIAAA